MLSQMKENEPAENESTENGSAENESAENVFAEIDFDENGSAENESAEIDFELNSDKIDPEWIDVLYDLLQMNQKRKNILKDVDLISIQSSRRRILKFQFLLSFVLVIIALCQIFLLGSMEDKVVIYRYNNKMNENLGSSKTWNFNHLIIITEDFEVFDFSMNQIKSPSKGKLLKLPISSVYFMDSDTSKNLYFIDGELRKPVVKYQEDKHETIKLNAKISHEHLFSQSLKIGNYFWMFGMAKKEEEGIYDQGGKRIKC